MSMTSIAIFFPVEVIWNSGPVCVPVIVYRVVPIWHSRNLIINEDSWTHQRNLLEVRRGNTFYDSDDKESVNQILALETSCLLTPRHTLVHEPKA
jgi:hypothetical protein